MLVLLLNLVLVFLYMYMIFVLVQYTKKTMNVVTNLIPPLPDTTRLPFLIKREFFETSFHPACSQLSLIFHFHFYVGIGFEFR